MFSSNVRFVVIILSFQQNLHHEKVASWYAEAHSKSIQTTNTDFFMKVVYGLKSSTISAKRFMLVVWLASEYATGNEYQKALTHLFPMYPFLPPENIRKPYGFLMFSGLRERVHPFLPSEKIRKSYGFVIFSGLRERVHWEQMS